MPSAPVDSNFTLHKEKNFNNTVYADIFYIDTTPKLHVVDKAKNYQAAY